MALVCERTLKPSLYVGGQHGGCSKEDSAVRRQSTTLSVDGYLRAARPVLG